jgi:hypothetical protein
LFINQYNSLHLNKTLPNCSSRRGVNPLSTREHIMRVSIRSSTLSRITGAVAALWLYGGGAAWAGGGADLASLQNVINGLCVTFGMTAPNACPQLPNITQAVLEVAALGNNLPEVARAQNAIPPQYSIDAGNLAAVPTNIPVDSQFMATLPLAITIPSTSDVLATLTPLAFISQSSGTAVPTQPYDPTADTFLYAVGVASKPGNVNSGGGNLTNPDKVYFFYDDTSRTSANFNQGQIVAKFTFPLTVLNNDGTETASVPVTLQFKANNARDCSTSTVTSSLWPSTQTVMATQIGLDCAVVFSTSPTSPQKHAVFEVAVRLLVTGACKNDSELCKGGQVAMPPTIPTGNTDPPYFYFAITGKPGNVLPSTGNLGPNLGTWTAFGHAGDVLGFTPPTTTPPILPMGAYSIGLAPSAGPLLPGTPACTLTFPSDPTQTPFYSCMNGPMIYALCASLPTNANGVPPRPAVATYYALATSGETWLSAPFRPFLQADGTSAFACPSGM